ncbi:MAG: thiol-disulfide oxidoreductase DCC family protein [bacterium]
MTPEPTASREDRKGNLLVLYDGVCPLCNASVEFLLNRDTEGIFRFAPLQGETAETILERHGQSGTNLDSIAYVRGWETDEETIYRKSDGVLMALYDLGGAWSLLSYAWYLPRFLRDTVYNAIAAVRYSVFGKYDECRLPDPDQRERFLD